MWTRVFEGSGFLFGICVKQTTDDGYIILGNIQSSGQGMNDICLIKTNDIGDTLWTKTYGGTDDDAGYSVEQTNDGGYIVTGYTYSFSTGSPSLYLLKTDSLGDLQWSKTLNANTNNYGNEVHQTSDGGYIIVGNTGTTFISEVYLIKTDNNGNPLWAKTFGGALNDSGNSVQQTADGGYIITGFTYSFGAGDNDVYLIKTDTNGNALWTRAFGQMTNDRGLSVEKTYDGGYIVAGSLWGSLYLIKTDSAGNSACNQYSTATITGSPITQAATPPTITSFTNTIITFPFIPVNSGGTVTTFCTTVGISPTPTLPGGGREVPSLLIHFIPLLLFL